MNRPTNVAIIKVREMTFAELRKTAREGKSPEARWNASRELSRRAAHRFVGRAA